MLKLLIASATDEFAPALAEQVTGAYSIKTTREGKQTLEKMCSFKPDIMVLDLMLPGLDGISILQEAAARGISPAVLAVTRFASDYVLETLTRLNVAYVMSKPCDIPATAARLADIARHMEKPKVTLPEPRVTVSNLLLMLGMRAKLDGYSYAREAILLAMERPGQLVTKEIYPDVARICNSTKERVERSIRCAVKSALDRGDQQVWKRYFDTGLDGRILRPTNAEFIARIADQLTRDPENGQEFKKS